MITNNPEYTQAYTEVNCLLKYMPYSYINKLPEKLLTLIENQSDDYYYIEIDPEKGLAEQGLSQKAKDLLAVLKYNYWSTDDEKKKLSIIFYENEKKYQDELHIKYNPKEIFKNNEEKLNSTNIVKTDTQMVVYKENLFIKILSKIKNFFKKN